MNENQDLDIGEDEPEYVEEVEIENNDDYIDKQEQESPYNDGFYRKINQTRLRHLD